MERKNVRFIFSLLSREMLEYTSKSQNGKGGGVVIQQESVLRQYTRRNDLMAGKEKSNNVNADLAVNPNVTICTFSSIGHTRVAD